MGVILGLSAALAFGAADFFGGLASKKISPLVVAFISQLSAVPFVALALFFFPMRSLNWVDLGLAVVGGAATIVALQLLFRVLREGAMGVLTAITGIMSAIIPFIWAMFNGEELAAIAFLGIALAFVSIVVVAKGPEDASDILRHRKQVLMAAGAGVIFGAVWMLVARTDHDSGAGPLLVMRLAGVVTAALWIGRSSDWQSVRGLPAVQSLVSGCGAVFATIVFLVAARIDTVAVVSVLQGMAPLATTALAFAFLSQRLGRNQVVGLVLAMLASLCLAMG